MAREPIPLALVSLVRRNRRRYGGYTVHAGHGGAVRGDRRLVELRRRARRADCRRARRRGVGGYEIAYVRPTAEIVAASNGRLERIDFGAVLRVRRDGATTTLSTERSFFPSRRPDAGAGIALLRGRGHERGRPEGGPAPRRLGRPSRPTRASSGRGEGGRRRVPRGRGRPRPEPQRDAFLAEALRGARALHADDPPPGDVPPARLAAGDLDLARRPDRLPRRPDRALAVPRAVGRRVTAGLRGARRPRGPRTRA